jgi:hypothetical protein
LHEEGTKLHLLINGKTACSAEASYGSVSSAMIETSSCPSVISVKKGDIASVMAEYDGTKHPRSINTSLDLNRVVTYRFRSSKIPLMGDTGATVRIISRLLELDCNSYSTRKLAVIL